MISNLIRTEDHPIVSASRARKSAGVVIFRVAVCVGAPGLEKPGQVRGPTVAGVAAVVVGLVYRAWVVAPPRSLQLGRALPVDIGRALDAAFAATGRGTEVHFYVEAVDEGDVEEVEVLELVEAVLGEGVGR